ncbi:MAG: FtsW/RodA/SpoVE family cell cycle protein [candidate division WOR-3 bacterium]
MRSGNYSDSGVLNVVHRPNRLWIPVSGRSGAFEYLPNSPIDYQLLVIVLALGVIGLITVYAATYHLGLEYLRGQTLRLLMGCGALWLGMKVNLGRIAGRNFQWLLLIIMLGLLAGAVVLGNLAGVVACRELYGFQPQEFVKYALVLWLAGYFDRLRNSDLKPNFVNTVVRPGLIVALTVGLTLAQPALGTSFIIAASSFFIFVLAGVRWRYLVPIIMVVGMLVGVWFIVKPVLRTTKFRYITERWDNFWTGDRYHQTQALIALGSGGPFGKGLGESRQKYYFLPKLHKDFIFCLIGEERGFLGTLILILLYILLVYRVTKVAERSVTEFGRLLSGGVGVVITIYAMVHIAVSLSLIPTTGQPLPFISYGGSALVSNMLAAGLVLNVSRHRRSGVDEEGVAGRGWNRRPYFSRARAG